MPKLPTKHRVSIAKTPAKRASAAERGYGRRWQQARISFLADHPLCAECEKSGKVTGAEVVDHIEPHKGDYEKFWSTSNWQALCDRCHNVKTAGEGAFGRPISNAPHQ